MENYVKNVHLKIPPDEARVQLLRCKLVGYRLAAELKDEGYKLDDIDAIFQDAYENLSTVAGRDEQDPYTDPCKFQYFMLEELRSYSRKDLNPHFMNFLRTEFKKVFVPTLRMLTDLCGSKNKYSWSEVKVQLQEIMAMLDIDVDWEECEVHLDRYMKIVAPIMPT